MAITELAKIRCFSGFGTMPGCARSSAFVRLPRPRGLRSVVAELLLVKHQLRSLNRAPNLRAGDEPGTRVCQLVDHLRQDLRF